MVHITIYAKLYDLYGFYEADIKTVAGAFKVRISGTSQRELFSGRPTQVFRLV